jgi:hypothetical protein
VQGLWKAARVWSQALLVILCATVGKSLPLSRVRLPDTHTLGVRGGSGWGRGKQYDECP